MFVVRVPKVDYTDPWATSFDDRLKSLAQGNARVAYYYDYPDNSTFRYRVYNMIQVLKESKSKPSAAYFSLKDIDYLDKVVDLADVLVFCRARYNQKINQAITRARNKGKQVIFDIDDLVFNPSYTHLILDTLAQDLNNPHVWDFWFGYIGRQSATLSLCDRVITTNAHLAAQLESYTGKPVSIIPNFMNREQLEISNRIYEDKKNNGFTRDHRIHIGYFSGTPSHAKDLDIAIDALIHLFKSDPRIVLRVVGFLDIKQPLYEYESRIEVFELQDFINLQRLIGEVEINLVPLQDNVFTNCKSELKYFEAAIVGTLTIASPTFTYRHSIRDRENGYLARSFEWDEKIHSMISDLEYYPIIAEKAYQDSQQKFAWYNQVDLVEQTLFAHTDESRGGRKTSP